MYGHAAGGEQRIHDADRDYLYRELLHVALLVRTPGERSVGRRASPFSLLWTHELLRAETGLDAGAFGGDAGRAPVVRADSTDSTASGGPEDPADRPVVADALTERGHTVALHHGDRKVITDGTTPSTVDPGAWYYLAGSDRGERHVETDPPDALVRACTEYITDPDENDETRGRVSDDTRNLLSALGYE